MSTDELPALRQQLDVVLARAREGDAMFANASVGVVHGARALDMFVPLADCVRVVGVQELAALGVPDAWLA